MVRHALAITSGTILAFYGGYIPDSLWIGYLPILLLWAWVQPRYRFLLLAGTACLWTGLHILMAQDSRLAPEYNNRVVQVSGVIADIPEIRPKSIRFLFKPENINAYPHSLPELIRLSWYRTERRPVAGERWQLLVKLKTPAGFQNPGGFDYERWLFVKRIGATGYVRNSNLNQRLDHSSRWHIDYWRTEILQTIKRFCTSCQNTGLIEALAIGYRGDIQPDQRKMLRDTGTAHLLAISGLHIGMVAALFYALGSGIWRSCFYRLFHNRIIFSACLAFAGGLMYAALAGFSLPTVRALVMLMVIFLSLYFRSGVNLLNSIAIAIVLILIVDPLAIGSASFWLSIGALLIIAFGQFLFPGSGRRWRQMISIQLLFSLLFIPVGIILFDQINPSSFFANVLAIPLVSLVIVPLNLIGSFLGSFNLSIAQYLFVASDTLLTVLQIYLNFLLNLGLDAYQGGRVPFYLTGLSAIGLIILLIPTRDISKRSALLLLVLPFFWHRPALEFGTFQLTVLDVGMGTSAVVQTRNHSLVYDFGPGHGAAYNTGDWVLRPFLRYQGIKAPDIMVISHVDADHSGGFYSYREGFDASRLVSGTPKELRDKFNLTEPVRSCHQYASWRWDGIEFEFLTTPGTEAFSSSNNRSCVLRIKGFQNALLAGDIESEQEQRLVQFGSSDLSATVMLVPHHGSATSSTSSFVRAVDPGIAIFTVGKGNRWNFPKPEVLEVYRDVGSEILRTDQEGAITVFSEQTGIRLEKFRSRSPRLWY